MQRLEICCTRVELIRIWNEEKDYKQDKINIEAIRQQIISKQNLLITAYGS